MMAKSKWGLFFLVLFVALPNQADAGFLSALAKILNGADEAATVAKSADDVAATAIKSTDDVATKTDDVAKIQDELVVKPVPVDEIDESSKIKTTEADKGNPNVTHSKTVGASSVESVSILEASGDLAVEVIETCAQNCFNEEEEKNNPSDSK